MGIMDEMGRILQVQEVFEQKGVVPVNMSAYPPGTYFISVKTEKAFGTEKVIKK